MIDFATIDRIADEVRRTIPDLRMMRNGRYFPLAQDEARRVVLDVLIIASDLR